jgi:hypothetical protein
VKKHHKAVGEPRKLRKTPVIIPFHHPSWSSLRKSKWMEDIPKWIQLCKGVCSISRNPTITLDHMHLKQNSCKIRDIVGQIVWNIRKIKGI